MLSTRFFLALFYPNYHMQIRVHIRFGIWLSSKIADTMNPYLKLTDDVNQCLRFSPQMQIKVIYWICWVFVAVTHLNSHYAFKICNVGYLLSAKNMKLFECWTAYSESCRVHVNVNGSCLCQILKKNFNASWN